MLQSLLTISGAAFAPQSHVRSSHPGRSALIAAVSEGMGVPSVTRKAEWNPLGLEMAGVPLLGSQFVPAYCKAAPAYLDGSLTGDIGFDPMCMVALARPSMQMVSTSFTAGARDNRLCVLPLEDQQACVAWMRQAELKHCRLAMLATVGWPLSEVVSGSGLAASNGRAPSLLNGALFDWPSFPAVVFIFGCLSALELETMDIVEGGDYGWDPLGLSSPSNPLTGVFGNVGDRSKLALSEIKHGRAAMLAITGFVAQEFVYGNAVVEQTPWAFGL